MILRTSNKDFCRNINLKKMGNTFSDDKANNIYSDDTLVERNFADSVTELNHDENEW